MRVDIRIQIGYVIKVGSLKYNWICGTQLTMNHFLLLFPVSITDIHTKLTDLPANVFSIIFNEERFILFCKTKTN